MKIKKGDTVLILLGKDKGKKGKVIQSVPEKKKVSVEGINLKKKHVRPKKSGEKGQIIEFPALMDISNVMLVCLKCGKATRTSYKVADTKQRICKKCKQEI